MKSWQKGALIVGTSATLISGGLWMLDPARPGTEDARQQQVERQMGQLEDADEMSKDRMRDQGNDGIDAENRRRTDAGEVRPRPRVRLPFP